MSTRSALALANHLATTVPTDGNYDAYLAEAFARWPDLSEAERRWAVRRAIGMSRREGVRVYAEADELERQPQHKGQTRRQPGTGCAASRSSRRKPLHPRRRNDPASKLKETVHAGLR